MHIVPLAKSREMPEAPLLIKSHSQGKESCSNYQPKTTIKWNCLLLWVPIGMGTKNGFGYIVSGAKILRPLS